MNLTQEKLKELLAYDPDTGIFVWKKNISNVRAGSIAGKKHNYGYRIIVILKKSYLSHRLAWFYTYGYWPKEIDHINRERSDNRIFNLRECTREENMANSVCTKKSKTGYRGIYKDGNQWCARVNMFGKRIIIGRFNNPEEAEIAYKESLNKYRAELGAA